MAENINYYDIKYKSAVGNIGMHIAVAAASPEAAAIISPIELTYGTPWKPEDFTVLEIKESKNKPITEEEQL